MRPHIALTVSLMIASCESPQADRTTTPAGSPERTTTEVRDAAALPFDQVFLDQMVPHHKGAVEMAQLARDRAEHAELKAMAETMISKQQREIEQMKEWRRAWYGASSLDGAAMPADAAKMGGHHDETQMADVKTLRDASQFDLAFINAMIPHHQQAVEMSQEALQKAQHPEVKNLASTMLEDQKKEIAELEKWRADWYPSAQVASPPE